jgi:hypothetical protein
MPSSIATRRQLVAALDEAFNGRGWHGPTLWASLRHVGAECAAWRPSPARHNIWELTVHAAYWKHVAIRRMTGERTPTFPSAGSNWFTRPNGTESSWTQDLDALEEEHERLRRTVLTLSESDLLGKNAIGRDRVDRTVRGIAAHDVYHAGQIQLLKRLWADR